MKRKSRSLARKLGGGTPQIQPATCSQARFHGLAVLRRRKQHIKKHRAIERHVDLHVTDGMQSYIKATRLFGRKTKHIIRGLQEQAVMYHGKLLFISNLPVERANSKVDAYIKLKVRESFSSFKQADRIRKAFMFTQIIQRDVFRCKGLGAFSTALKEQTTSAKISAPATIPH